MSAPVSVRAPASALAAALACASPDEPPPPVDLSEYGLEPPPPSSSVAAHLAWHAPSRDCPLVYRVRVDETYPPGLAELLHTQEEHSESYLAFGPRPLSAAPWPPGPVPRGEVVEGALVFRGPKNGGRQLQREWASSATLVGPGSPDAACFERTWDPVEDALALGWPALPGRPTALGESWRGAKVESRCNRAACVDPETRGGGAVAHHRPCTTMSWEERLVGLRALGGGLVAELESVWSDGHELGVGLWAERSALVDVDRGRLVRAEAFIHHTFTGIERQVRVDAIDACPGGLVAAGWTPPERLAAALDELRAALERATRTTR